MPQPPEVHRYLDDLYDQGIYGVVVISLERGEIKSIQDRLNWKPADILAAYKDEPIKEVKKIILIVRNVVA